MLRLPPQAFPASRFLLGLTATMFTLTLLAGNFVLVEDLSYALGRALLSVFNVGVAAALVLAMARRGHRWQQTVTALFGGETVIGLLLLPVLAVNAAGIENIFILLSVLLFLVWELVFIGFVYRNALDSGMGAGIAIAIVYVTVSSLVKQQLVPFPAS